MGRFTSLELETDTLQHGTAQEETPAFGEKQKGADDFLHDASETLELCNYENALQLFSKVLSFDNKNSSAWFWQIRCLIYLNEFKEATMWTDKAIEMIGETPELLAAKACAYCRMGDFSRAYGLSDVSMEQKGTSDFVWVCRGEILLQQKRQNYNFCFDQALTAPVESWRTMVEIARVYMFYNKAGAGLTYLEIALENVPSKAVVWYELGNCYADMGMKNKALESYTRAQEISPHMRVAGIRYKQVKKTGFMSNLKRNIFG